MVARLYQEKERNNQTLNWASSVEPVSAARLEEPMEAIFVISSKKPVPTKRWCLTAI